jgi:hypothetical protein
VKRKKTFSLSPEAVEYLESVRRQKKAPSTSTVLDELIREKKLQAQLEKADAAISAYYDSLSDDEQADDIAWGKFGISQFPREE